MAENDVLGSMSPMIITSAHRDKLMNSARVDEILALGKIGSDVPTLLRIETAAGNWYLLERNDGEWLLKSGTGGLPKGITFTEIRDGQLYTADGQKYTQKLTDIFETDERGRPLKSLK